MPVPLLQANPFLSMILPSDLRPDYIAFQMNLRNAESCLCWDSFLPAMKAELAVPSSLNCLLSVNSQRHILPAHRCVFQNRSGTGWCRLPKLNCISVEE